MNPKQNKKIVRIITRLNVGGPAKHVAWLSAGLNNKGWESIVVHGKIEDNENDLSHFCKQHQVETLLFPSLKRNISLFGDLRSIWHAFNILKTTNPNIIHTHTSKAGLVGRVASLLFKIFYNRKVRIVHTFHGHTFHSYFSSSTQLIFLYIERFLAKYCTDAIVTISAQQHDEILKKYKVGNIQQHCIIPLGIDFSFTEHLDKNALRDDFDIPRDAKLFGIVGRIADVKNHQLFISSIAKFNNKYQNDQCYFIIIGEGLLTETELLKSYAQQLGISNLLFAGNLDKPQYFYGALDYLVLTSKNEGTPVAILEAFATEIPVISTEVGGVVDLIGNQERGIISTPDAEDFAKKFKMAIDNDHTVMLKKAKEYVYQNHSLESLVNKVDTLYSDLLGHTK